MKSPPRGFITVTMAVFVDKFTGMDPDKIAKLTDRQLHEIYLRKRDRDGKIDVNIALPTVEAQSEEETYESSMENLSRLRMSIPEQLLPASEFERMKTEITKRYGKDKGPESG